MDAMDAFKKFVGQEAGRSVDQVLRRYGSYLGRQGDEKTELLKYKETAVCIE